MNLTMQAHQTERRRPGWHSRGYLPHYDGRAIPQFLTVHLADSIPKRVIEVWRQQLNHLHDSQQQLVLRKRIETYLDAGHGECALKDFRIATLVQNSLLAFDSLRYELFAWVVMPNHTHSLLTCHDDWILERVMHSHKSYTAHEANRILNRNGSFWMKEYFDRYIRNAEHFRNTIRYIENNPVKAGLCDKPSDWPFSSAWFRQYGG